MECCLICRQMSSASSLNHPLYGNIEKLKTAVEVDMWELYLLIAMAGLVPSGCFLWSKSKLWLLLSIFGIVFCVALRALVITELSPLENLMIFGLLSLSVVAPMGHKTLRLAREGEKERSSKWGIITGIFTIACALCILPWVVSQLF